MSKRPGLRLNREVVRELTETALTDAGGGTLNTPPCAVLTPVSLCPVCALSANPVSCLITRCFNEICL